MEFRRRTLKQIADLICGNEPDASTFFVYRSSSYLTEFFEEIDREEFVHDETAILAVLLDSGQRARLKEEPGLCHGAAGILHCAWRMSADARTPGIRRALPRLAAQVADALSTTSQPAGPGLLDGIAGAALALHSIGTGSAPAPYWDSFLALA